MPIILVRIDDRLIHGQIVEGWLKEININHIVIVSDEVAKNKLQQTLLGMAVPSNIKVTNFSVDDASKKIYDICFEKDRILLLFSHPRDVLSLIKSGVKLVSINVGGMHYGQGKKQILKNLSVDKDDILIFKEIGSYGVELEGRVLPGDERVNIYEIICKEISN